MIFLKNKWKKRLRSVIGIVLAMFIVSAVLCIGAFAETSGIMSEIIPDGTNVPDTDIGGATGMESSLLPPMSTPDASNGTIPQTNAGTESSMIGDTADQDTIGNILGIIIAVIVVLAVIILIIALIPKRTDKKNSGNKGGKNSRDNF